MALLSFYLSAILVSAFACGVLSLFGSIVIARERITNVLFFSQTAKLGLILGLSLNLMFNMKSSFVPLIISILFAAIFYVISEYVGAKALANKESIFLALFVIALQMEEVFLFLFRGVEKHELGQFLGDIVTIAGDNIFWLSGVALLFLLIFIFYEKKWFIESFNQMILKSKNKNFDNFILYHVSVMIFVTICVLFMGLWLTLASLLVPAIFLSKLPFSNRWVYYIVLLSVSVGGCLIGFIGSLLIENSPTTPFVICTIALLTLIIRLAIKFRLVFSQKN